MEKAYKLSWSKEKISVPEIHDVLTMMCKSLFAFLFDGQKCLLIVSLRFFALLFQCKSCIYSSFLNSERCVSPTKKLSLQSCQTKTYLFNTQAANRKAAPQLLRLQTQWGFMKLSFEPFYCRHQHPRHPF